jgi:hypothetical protein
MRRMAEASEGCRKVFETIRHVFSSSDPLMNLGARGVLGGGVAHNVSPQLLAR